MAERVQINQDLGLNSPLHPVARPVDTYYRPQAETVQLEGGGDFASLAQSVGAVVPVFDKILSEEEKYQQDKAIKEGAKARLTNQKSFKEAVQSGQLRQAENPWFVKGYMQQDGRISGMNYDEALRTAWAESDVKNSDKPGDLAKFMGDFRQKWISENDGQTADWMDGFAPKMAQADNNLSAQHVAHRMKAIEDTAKANHGIEMRKLQDRQTELEAGLDPNDPLVMEGRRVMAAQMEAITADFVRKGMDGKDANRIIADQVITKGIELRDTDYARNILNMIKTPGGSVSKISDVAAKLTSAEETIRDRNWQDKQHERADEDRPFQVAQRDFGLKQIEHTQKTWDKEKISDERNTRVRAQTNELTMKILAKQPVSTQDYINLAKDDASAAAWVKNFRHTMLSQEAQVVPDRHAVAQMMLRIASDDPNVTARDIFGGVSSGKWDTGTAMTMWNEKQQMDGPGQDPASKDRYWSQLNHGLVSGIAGNLENISGSAPFDAADASVEFRKYRAEVMADDTTKPSEKMALLRKRQRELMEFYNPTGAESSKAITKTDATGAVKPEAAAGPKIRGEGNKNTPTPGPGTPAVPAKAGTPSPAALNYLLANPATAADFEKYYSLPPGSAQNYINRNLKR